MSTRTEKEQVRVHIRWMIRRDMPEVLQTEQHSFEFPWTEEDFLRCLRQRNCIGMVAEQGEKVVGFMIYELHKNKLHILNFAVHPGFRRAGVGSTLEAGEPADLIRLDGDGRVTGVMRRGEWVR